MQPVSAFQWAKVSGGTSITAVSASPGVLHSVIVPGTYVGTLAVYDSATAAGTAAGNLIATFGLPALVHPNVIRMDVTLKNGLTYDATGTPLMTLTYL